MDSLTSAEIEDVEDVLAGGTGAEIFYLEADNTGGCGQREWVAALAGAAFFVSGDPVFQSSAREVGHRVSDGAELEVVA